MLIDELFLSLMFVKKRRISVDLFHSFLFGFSLRAELISAIFRSVGQFNLQPSYVQSHHRVFQRLITTRFTVRAWPRANFSE